MKLRTVHAKIRALLSVGIIVVLTTAGGGYLSQQYKDKNTRLASLSRNLRYWVVRSLLLETRSLAENDAALLKGVQEANLAIGEIIAKANRLSSREDDRQAIAALQDRQEEHEQLFGVLQAIRHQMGVSRKTFETTNIRLQKTALGLINAIGDDELTAMMTGEDMHPNVLETKDLMRELLIAYGRVTGNFQALLVLSDEAAYTQSRGPIMASLGLVKVNIDTSQSADAVQKYAESITAILSMLEQNLKEEAQLFQLWRDARDGTQKMRQVVDQVQAQATNLADSTERMTVHFETIGARIMIALLLGSILLFLVIGLLIARNIGWNLKRMAIDLSRVVEQIRNSAADLSESSHIVAESASGQASSIEETSSSLEKMAAMTKSNAQNAIEADKLAKSAGRTIAETTSAMSHMATAMSEIVNTNEETSKIIKTIDAIAFQTNLLALNAAIEAARAGDAGAGFAVVADEVRKLAMRTTEAAKNTADMIEGITNKVQEGATLAKKTSDAVQKMNESGIRYRTLVSEITAASQEQSTGFEHVNLAVAEMDKVVQQNASTAEESASASAEINKQAQQMIEIAAALERLVMQRKKRSLQTGDADGATTRVRRRFGKRADSLAYPKKRLALPPLWRQS